MRIRIYAGQYFDAETGLHYNYHRYYDPKTGRYLTPDPIGLLGGINLYVYTANNPVNAIDSDGLETLPYPGVGPGLGIPWHPGFQPGTPENDYIADDIQDFIQWNLILPWKILIWMAGAEEDNDSCPKDRSPYPPARRNKSKSKKDAYEKAKKAGKGKEPIHDPDGEHGPHYHPDVPMPKPDQVTPKRPNPHDHYYYPKRRK